jgi:quercetin dioxygenase-like cupin family protein
MGRKGRIGWMGGVLVLALVASGFNRTQTAEMQRIPQFENDRVSVWRSVIPPHTQSTLHRHDRGRTVVAIVGGELKTITPEGRVAVTRYETGKAIWFEPMPPGETHRDVNDTDRTIEVVTVEMKQ